MPPRLRSSFSSSRPMSSASFLGMASNSPESPHALVLLHLGDALGDRLEVGEHAAEPALVDVRHAALLGIGLDRVLRLLLRADEQHRAAVGDEVTHERVCGLDPLQRLLEIDDVDAVALAVDEPLHLRVPAAGLMAEVHPGLEQLFHGDDGRGHGGVSLPAVSRSSGPHVDDVRSDDRGWAGVCDGRFGGCRASRRL